VFYNQLVKNEGLYVSVTYLNALLGIQEILKELVSETESIEKAANTIAIYDSTKGLPAPKT
jgi:hypothetical protein